ncbi:hypothetical protein [Rufibacter immobilis]|uniref:hypothetical protein n=1 Tax=Rufibacter immobilis TaxID=1348778 RepID=UPI0035F0A69A
MTIHHIFYIPTIFVLGLVVGTMINSKGEKNTVTKEAPYKTSAKLLLQSFLIFIIVFVITHVYEIPAGVKAVSRLLGGMDIFDKHPIFSATQVYERIESFPDAGLQTYRRFTYTIDVLFPVSLFIFLFTFVRFVSQRVAIPTYLSKAFISLPFLWLGFDLIENAVIFTILSGFPHRYYFLASSLGSITIVKFGLLFLSILTPSLFLTLGKKKSGVSKHF